MSKRSKRDRALTRNAIQQREQHHTVVTRTTQELRIGPLPKPQELAEFEAVLPGLAERIVAMAEANGIDRRRTNRTIRWATILGQVFAFIFVMTALGGGFYLLYQGKDVAGMATIITAIAIPLGALAYNRTRQQ